MELRHLITFRTVARLRGFRRAAEALGYVQANVTAHIHALEAELGVQLFDRLGRHIALTDAGKQLLGYADQLITISQEAQAAITHRDGMKGSLTISASETLCIYRLPPLLRQFQEHFPQVKLVYRPLPYPELRRSVSEGIIDLAFVMEPPLRPSGVIVEELCPEPILLLVAPDHPLAQVTMVQPADLETETLLLNEVGCSYRGIFEQHLAAAGIVPQTILEFSSIEAIKQCTMLGMGVAVLPAVAVTTELAQNRLVAMPWTGGEFAIRMQMLWHKEKWISPAMQAFLDTFRAALRMPITPAPGLDLAVVAPVPATLSRPVPRE